jgi:foldase protein PrsA
VSTRLLYQTLSVNRGTGVNGGYTGRALFRVLACVLLAVLVLLAAACGSGSKSESKAVPDDAAAVVGDLTIPKTRISLLLDQAAITYASQHRNFPKPGTPAFRGLRGRAVAYLAVGAMYEGKAKEEGITATDAEVKAQVAKDRRLYGKTPAAQKAALKRARMTDEELETEARLKVIQQKIQARVFENVKVSDAEVRQFYKDNKDKFTIPESRVVRQILVQSKPLALRLMNLARSGSDFGSLARQYSTDKPTASVGGKVAIRKGQTSPAFDKVAFSIATGKISEPIATQYGWQILQAIAPVRLAIVTPLSEVSSEIRRELLQERREKALGRWQIDAKDEFCDGEVAYAPGYRPFTDDNPCSPSAVSNTQQPSG